MSYCSESTGATNVSEGETSPVTQDKAKRETRDGEDYRGRMSKTRGGRGQDLRAKMGN